MNQREVMYEYFTNNKKIKHGEKVEKLEKSNSIILVKYIINFRNQPEGVSNCQSRGVDLQVGMARM